MLIHFENYFKATDRLWFEYFGWIFWLVLQPSHMIVPALFYFSSISLYCRVVICVLFSPFFYTTWINFLGVSPSSPNAAIYGETGRFPLHIRQQNQVLKLWLYIQNMPRNSVIHQIYREPLDLSQQDHKNWASQVNMFSKFRIPIVDIDKLSREELKSFQSQFREKRYSYYMYDWHRVLNDPITTRKLCTYCVIKTDHRLEPYLLYILNKRHQQAMARLRVSSHKLEIELGRHSRPHIPKDERLCTFYKQKEIGDEVHFLMTCDFLALERDHLFRETFPLHRHQWPCGHQPQPQIDNEVQKSRRIDTPWQMYYEDVSSVIVRASPDYLDDQVQVVWRSIELVFALYGQVSQYTNWQLFIVFWSKHPQRTISTTLTTVTSRELHSVSDCR